MSMSVGAGAGDEEEGGGSALSEINVTPLVDVMLVLLVIFMVTAPLINQAGLDVELPSSKTGTVKDLQSESATVSIESDGSVWIDDRKLSAKDFKTKFSKIIKERKPKAVFLRADKNVRYELVVEVMDELREAGVTKLGMVTKPQS